MADNDPGSRKDPATTFLFGLKITDLSLDHLDGTAFFRSVSGLKMDTEVVDYQEGGVTGFTRKVIGVTKWSNIVLKQGFSGDIKLWDWRYNPRRVPIGTIYQLGPELKPLCRWEFKNGYPVKWEGPDYDASKNDLAIEMIEIAHEGLEIFEEEST
jgi:phage tail-like protein